MVGKYFGKDALSSLKTDDNHDCITLGASSPAMKSDDASAFHVAYSSRLPNNAWGGPTGHGAAPGGKCFSNGHAFAAPTVDWVGKHIPACNTTDAPVALPNGTFCFTSPRVVKQCLSSVPIGRRAVHLQGAIFLEGPITYTQPWHDWRLPTSCGGWGDINTSYTRGCSLWADEWQHIVSKRFEDWFAQLKALGGSVDVIMLDFESTPYWEYQHFANDTAQITSDPRWPDLMDELNAKGAEYSASFDNISDMHSWGADPMDWRQYVWPDVMLSRRGSYLNASFFEPARKSFPNVKASDYDHSHRPKPGGQHWAYSFGGVTKSPVCCGSHVGTHQSRSYYGWSTAQKPIIAWTSPASKNGMVPALNVTAPNTPWHMLIHYVRQIRGELLQGVPLMPWVQPKTSNWYSKLCHEAPCGTNHSSLAINGAWEEAIFHYALSGVDEFLWYRSGEEFPVTEGIEHFTAVLAELSDVVGQASTMANAHCLSSVLTFEDDVIVSGIQGATGSLYRLSTRDMKYVTVVEEHPATFRISGSSKMLVPVADGVLLYRTNSTGEHGGFWITSSSRSSVGSVCHQSTAILKTDDTHVRSITLGAGTLNITVGLDGSVELVTVAGRDILCGTAGETRLMSASMDGHRVNVTSVALEGAILTAKFGSSGVTVRAVFNSTGDFIVLTVVSVAGTNVTDLVIVELPVKGPLMGRTVAAAYGDSTSLLLLPATLSVDVMAEQRDEGCVVMSARSYAASGLEQSVAIWGGDGGINGLRDSIQAGEQAFGLPSPTIGLEWAKTSPALPQGYFLMSVDPTTLNQTIEYALQSGMPYITMLVHSWTTQGHYNISSAWGDLSGLKVAVQQVQSRGLKVGLHSLSANIATTDPYVTPVPDPRLAKRGGLNLGAGIGAADSWLPLTQKPSHLPDPYGNLAPAGGLDVMIDSEIMTYSRTNDSAPFGIAGVKRGAYGTTAAPHKKDADVYYMLRSGDGFLPDPSTTLLDELAANLARSYNELGAEMIYCDGLEHLLLTGHFAMAQFQNSLFRHLRGDVLAESSSETCHTWHINARSGQTDWAATDSRVFMDDTKAQSCLSAQENLQGADMGWWGYLTYSQGSFYATTPDEIEYMASRSVGYNASPNLETSITTLMANGRTMEAFRRMKPWWSLNLTDGVKKQLVEAGVGFRLEATSGEGVIIPVRVHPAHVSEPGLPETLHWDLSQYFDRSTTRGVRIRALSCVKDSSVRNSSGDNINLLRLSDSGVVRTTKCKSAGAYVPALHSYEMSAKKKRRDMSTKNTTVAFDLNSTGGRPSLRMNYSAPSVMSVGCLRQRFATPLDLTNNTALLVDIFGDAR